MNAWRSLGIDKLESVSSGEIQPAERVSRTLEPR